METFGSPQKQIKRDFFSLMIFFSSCARDNFSELRKIASSSLRDVDI